MICIDSDILYNKKYIVIVPASLEENFDDYEYSFGNCILMKNNLDAVDKFVKFVEENTISRLVFIDYQLEFEELIKRINKPIEINWILTTPLGAFSNEYNRYIFNSVYKLYSYGLIKRIGVCDPGLFETLRNHNNNIFQVFVDTKTNSIVNECSQNNSVIGLLNSQYKSTHSFYNELSAIKLLDGLKSRIFKPNKETKRFIKMFKINHEYTRNFNRLFDRDLAANLYINFTDNDIRLFLKSMDNNIPCILGNTSILNKYPNLKKRLVMSSDDDIDEIADRVRVVLDKRQLIFEDYKEFRKDYSKLVKETNNVFFENDEAPLTNEYEKLISVIVPVYNTEDYLDKSLKSILNAIPSYLEDKIEILVINDGSKDNSEKIIKKYEEKHKNIIRYISQKNHGLGNVRNVGLKEAKGKYIASIDSDDTINQEFFDDAMNFLNNDIDVVIYDWLTITDSEQYVQPAIEWIFKNKKTVYEGLMYTTIMPSTCNKIYKKSLFDKLNIRYVEDKYEDLSCNPFILLAAETIKYIQRPYYEYYIRSNSIMRSSSGVSMMSILIEFSKRLKKYKKYANINLDEFLYYVFSWRIEEYVINPIYNISDKKELKEYLSYLDKNFLEILKKLFNNKYYVDMLNGLNENKKQFIKLRNEAILNKRFDKFINDNNDIVKLNPSIIYFGDN